MSTLGERINILIKREGITQKELAKFTNIPLRTLANIIKGDVEPGLYKICLIAAYFNVSLDWLVHGFRHDPLIKHKKSALQVAEKSSIYNATPASLIKRIHQIIELCGGKDQLAALLNISQEKLDQYLHIDIPVELLEKIVSCACEKGKNVDIHWLLTGERISDRLLKGIAASLEQDKLSATSEIIEYLLKLNQKQIDAILALVKIMDRKD
jgi:transcriptional regulator with XRE-family HTH domain